MLIPALVKLALVAKAANAGAKAGIENERRSQNFQAGNNTQSAATTISVRVETSAVSVPVSIERKKAIELLLTKAKYIALLQLRNYIKEQHSDIDFYGLFEKEEGVVAFLQQHPRLADQLLKHVQVCIQNFFSELEQPSQVVLPLRSQERHSHGVEQSRYVMSFAQQKARALQLKLSKIEFVFSQSGKMELLQQIEDDAKNTIGHLCLGYKKSNSGWYADILYSLQPNNLFTILKLNNYQEQSIFSLYCAAGLNVFKLISRCKEEPLVFCQILETFELDNPTIQSLVNVVGLKERIRTYLLNLPDEPNHKLLLEHCLEQSTTIGKFCAKEANRIHHSLQQGGDRLTVTSIRDKLKAQIRAAVVAHPVVANEYSTEVLPQVVVASAPPISLAPNEMFFERKVSNNASLAKTANSSSQRTENIDTITTVQAVVPSIAASSVNSEFRLYVGCAIVFAACLVGLMSQYLNPTQE